MPIDERSFSEREPSIRASELKSDFRTGRSSALITKNPSMSESLREETVYSKEESFNKLTPKGSTLDHNALKNEFQKNGVINISDYLDSNKDRDFNRNNSKTIEQEEDSLISSRNLKLFTKNILM